MSKCCERKTIRDESQKNKLINRLKRIEGQIRGIRNMIEEDSYCNDILTQCSAASSALNAVSKEVLTSHIHSCVIKDIKEGKDEVVDELMLTILKMMR